MTIGIAAAGPGAGRAVVRALRAVESVGRGAIGGFVSLAAIDAEGRLHRAECQRGGAAALFGSEPMPEAIATAPLAGLMSSGPDRPEPLAQFVPADGAVGLVTGHRLPNVAGASGRPLNEEVLALMRQGRSPEAAVAAVVEPNPRADAGIIALDRQGRLAAADTLHVRARSDRGAAIRRLRPDGPAVAVLHNAILPYRAIATLAQEVALDAMEPLDATDGAAITLEAGVPLELADQPAYVVGPDGQTVTRILVTDPRYLSGEWGLGLGHDVAILREGMGDNGASRAAYEPYLVVTDGRLRSGDGRRSLLISMRAQRSTG